jgi:hypothetical protein
MQTVVREFWSYDGTDSTTAATLSAKLFHRRCLWCSGTFRPPLLSCSVISTQTDHSMCLVPSTANAGTNTSWPDPNWLIGIIGSLASSSSDGSMPSATSPSSSRTCYWNELVDLCRNNYSAFVVWDELVRVYAEFTFSPTVFDMILKVYAEKW